MKYREDDFFIFIWLSVLLPCLLTFGSFCGVGLYMYIQYKKIRKEKEHLSKEK
ncbi:unnamed protein product [Meloidogyne enterolobii]|uniref:Uncharacterized protein n=1 Tax=Meloidogyne enterolobii TaxID=390850 RepID=A0ACB0ZGE8_MELEN